MDNRLDYIGSFEDGTTEKMSELRSKFIELDKALLAIQQQRPLANAALRTLALARTNLETASMYGIKTLCLAYEKSKE